MSQYWMVVNLDKRVTSGPLGTLGGSFFTGTPGSFYPFIVIPADIEWVISHVKFTINRSLTRHLGHLDISNELLDLIFSELDEIQDMACFSLTNSHLLQLGYKHITKLVKSKLWTGDRIICIGELAQANDLPPNMLTDEETQEVEKFKRLQDSQRGPHDGPSCHGSFYSFILYKFKRLKFGQELVDTLPSSEGHKCSQLSKLEVDLFEHLTDQYGYYRVSYVLCNISKWEYVRGEAIAAKFTSLKMVGSDIKGPVGWGEALLSQICWSSNSSVSLPSTYRGQLHCGAWAGDRVEVVAMNKMRPVMEKGKEWNDVTERVLREIVETWESVHEQRYMDEINMQSQRRRLKVTDWSGDYW